MSFTTGGVLAKYWLTAYKAYVCPGTVLTSNSQARHDLSCWLGCKPQHKQPTTISLQIHEKHTDQPFLPKAIISKCSMRPSFYVWIWKLLLQGWTGVYILPSHTPFSFLPPHFSLLPLSSFTHLSLSLLQSLSRSSTHLLPFPTALLFSPTPHTPLLLSPTPCLPAPLSPFW